MKKGIVGAVVGGIIMFVWQFLSFVLIDLHRPSQEYTEKQDEVLSFLATKFDKDGQYFMPNTPAGASADEQETAMKNAAGKPWAVISYHTSMDVDMTMNMVRGLLTDIIMIGLFCWILSNMRPLKFATILLSSVFTGLIVFCNVPYTNHIWYEIFDLNAYLIDAVVAWGLVGIWLGYLYSPKEPKRVDA